MQTPPVVSTNCKLVLKNQKFFWVERVRFLPGPTVSKSLFAFGISRQNPSLLVRIYKYVHKQEAQYCWSSVTSKGFAKCCSMLQCVAVPPAPHCLHVSICRVLQCVAVCNHFEYVHTQKGQWWWTHVATHGVVILTLNCYLHTVTNLPQIHLLGTYCCYFCAWISPSSPYSRGKRLSPLQKQTRACYRVRGRGCLKLQVSFRKRAIIGFFCGKWPVKIRLLVNPCYRVFTDVLSSAPRNLSVSLSLCLSASQLFLCLSQAFHCKKPCPRCASQTQRLVEAVCCSVL